MAKSFEELTSTAETIRTNVLPESNTAGLVGRFLKDMVEKLQEVLQVDELAELKKRVDAYIQANSHTKAYAEDFLYVEDFAHRASIKDLVGTQRHAAVEKALNTWLDGITFTAGSDEMYMGRCKLICDGVNVECYNYVCSWADNIGIQQIMGAAAVGTNGKVNYGSEHNILFRTREKGTWGAWASYALRDMVNTPITDEEINKLF